MKKKNKTILLTGGARIGSDVAITLAKEGYDFALTYRSSKKKTLETVKKIKDQGAYAEAFKVDLSDPQKTDQVVRRVVRTFRQIDAVIAMASDYDRTPFNKVSVKTLNRFLQSNLAATFHVCHSAIPFLKKTKGRIITFSDWIVASGRPTYQGFLPYFVAKSGIQGLTQALARELAPNVLVNSVAPGPILPPEKISNDEVRDIKKVTPLKKWGGSIEIVKTVRFLLETGFVTGETIRVDGGRHLQ